MALDRLPLVDSLELLRYVYRVPPERYAYNLKRLRSLLEASGVETGSGQGMNDWTTDTWRAILDGSPDGVVVCDATASDCPVVYVNSAFATMSGYTSAQLMGANLRLLQGTDRQQESRQRMKEAIDKGEPCRVLIRNYRPDGALRTADALAFNIWVARLGATSGNSVTRLPDLLGALRARHDDFHAHGCRLSDHGLEVCPVASCADADASTHARRYRSSSPAASTRPGNEIQSSAPSSWICASSASRS